MILTIEMSDVVLFQNKFSKQLLIKSLNSNILKWDSSFRSTKHVPLQNDIVNKYELMPILFQKLGNHNLFFFSLNTAEIYFLLTK